MCSLLQWDMVSVTVRSILARCQYHDQGTSSHCVSTAIWGPSLSTSQVLYQCNNSSVVAAINKGSARDTIVIHLLRSLCFLLPLMIQIWYVNMQQGWLTLQQTTYLDITTLHFFTKPGASLVPTPLPPPLLEIISIPRPDWTLAHFNQVFISTINTVQQLPHTSSTALVSSYFYHSTIALTIPPKTHIRIDITAGCCTLCMHQLLLMLHICQNIIFTIITFLGYRLGVHSSNQDLSFQGM